MWGELEDGICLNRRCSEGRKGGGDLLEESACLFFLPFFVRTLPWLYFMEVIWFYLLRQGLGFHEITLALDGVIWH